ncbi:MAG: glycosyltransferase family A protein [Terricaulis sp.]
MSAENPVRVSVIVPTRDRPAFLRQALASIRAIEGPDLSFEILVGDNGSSPETRQVAEDHGAKHIQVARNGAGAARNAGLEAASGEYIAFLDDDDVWMAGNVRAQLAMLAANPNLEGVVGQVVCTDQALDPIMAPWPAECPGEGGELILTMLSGYYPQIGATLVRASAAKAVGLFDEKLLGDQDWDWQLRVARRRKLGYVAEQCVLFRQRPPGTFDALRLSRLGFARRVFFRHAIAEWRTWNGWGRFTRAYRNMLWQYYEYFTDAAIERAQAGDYVAARRAMLGAFRTFPLRAAYHSLSPRPLRAAFVAAAFGRPMALKAKDA